LLKFDVFKNAQLMEIFSNHPLKAYNSFGIKVYAQKFIKVTAVDELVELLKEHSDGYRKLYILGDGSNILFTGDFDGTIVKLSNRGIEVLKEDDEEVHLRVAAGEDWDGLVEFCVNNGWGGLENLSGIPGQVGSSPIQNIGAYGSELKDHFISLEAVNKCSGEPIKYTTEDCRFGYRDSIFKRALRGRVVITHVVFRLSKKPVFNLSYRALSNKLGRLSSEEINLKKIREAVLEIRASKLPDPKVIGNAGSFFKNPVVSTSLLEELKERFPGIVYYESSQFPVPSSQFPVPSSQFPVPSSQSNYELLPANCELRTANYKLAAGWLIEQAGWKGYREGDAGVHKDQALVLVNYGKATGREILDLSKKIQRSVNEMFGIELEKEVNVV
jgi:UDP-N-acetylmuramate dehydrogenase